MDEYMKDILKWQKPKDKDRHWPQYSDFDGKDYDPNRWEGFPEEKGYYLQSGHKQFEDSSSSFERLYAPYPDYQSSEYRSKFKGDFVSCNGPRGKPLNESDEDSIRVYDSVPNAFPEPFIGSHDAVGLHTGMCFDRAQRYGPYGVEPLSKFPISYVDWDKVYWGHLQNECVAKNENRFAPQSPQSNDEMSEFMSHKVSEHRPGTSQSSETKTKDGKTYQSRTAILLRTWEGYEYSDNDIMVIRSMVTELSLQSGGEFQVFLLVNIKDRSQPIFTDARAYRKTLRKVVPRELQDIAILWSEEICERLYPDVGDWQVYWQQFMPVQWFSESHPEFDYVWNWEMDVRYIGNHYHFLTQVGYFAGQQSRKYLWERNARFYIPSFHGSDWNTYLNDTNAIIADSVAKGEIPEPIWGAKTYSSSQKPLGPTPPRSQDADSFEWGVGEEADFITLLPIWDPVKTRWTMKNKVWNYTPGIRPQFSRDHPTDDDFTHPSLKNLPRRGYINTVARLSKRLLHAMHLEQMAGRSMQAEMWPSSVALQHGFKAVYVPQPVYSGRQWPGRYADAVFNSNGGIGARWGQEDDSIYNQDREQNFRSWSWYYHAEFPKVLYRRWMGWKSEDSLGNVGGQEWEQKDDGPKGRMCLPPMLLHPVKRRDIETS
ncbi:hypothetical protein BT63DRAFT_368044 [Microthyrium microscopicum]|uniref:Major facilitator superfamily transporter n=1 Tax=Microthyrium microscopicum TaxID=703497 RepID=A0A6A6UML5_9PEZI|nr:hypothetical protein BT63DRAFT_368044 [Microthyrium microscopicum]